MDISNKTCLVTGATGGLGKSIAIELARKQAKVVITARDQASGESALSEIKQKSGSQNVSLLVVDLSSQRSIRKAADEFKSTNKQLHILANCAAVYKAKRELTEDGLETMFATNHLGYFLITHLLRDVLTTSAPAKIINITAPSTVKINFDDLQGEKKFSSLWAFGASKMANLLFTFALAKKLEGSGVTVNAFHPGLMKTNLMHEAIAPMRWLLKIISKSPEMAAESIMKVITAPEFEGKNGKFFANGKEIQASAYAYDAQIQDRLWEESLKLSGMA